MMLYSYPFHVSKEEMVVRIHAAITMLHIMQDWDAEVSISSYTIVFSIAIALFFIEFTFLIMILNTVI